MENWQEIGQAVQTAIKTKDMAIDGGAVVTGFTVFGLSGNEVIAVLGVVAAGCVSVFSSVGATWRQKLP